MNALRYVDPKADLAFKKIFGEHPDLVISLLNALLPLPDDDKIVTIEYLPPEIVPDDPLHKDSIVDVRCKDQHQRQFIVEMQMIWTPDYNQRALFNAAKAYSRELPRGGDYGALKTVYSLNLLNENLDLDSSTCYHQYRLEHSELKDQIIDGIQIVFVELKKFKPQTWTERKMAALWLRFLTEIDEKTGRAPQELEENPEVKKALDIIEVAALTPEERAHYDGFQDWLCRERAKAARLARLGEAEANLEKANADLLKAEADLQQKNADLQKAEADLQQKSADLQKAETERQKAETERQKAEAERDEANARVISTAKKLKEIGLSTEQIVLATGLEKACIDAL